jgi:hypothetical protein
LTCGPNQFIVAFFADCEFRQRGDEEPRFAGERFVLGTFTLERVVAGHLHETVDGGALAEILCVGVEFNEQVHVFWEAARACAETAHVFLGYTG